LLKNLGFPKEYKNRSQKFSDSALFFLNVVFPILYHLFSKVNIVTEFAQFYLDMVGIRFWLQPDKF